MKSFSIISAAALLFSALGFGLLLSNPPSPVASSGAALLAASPRSAGDLEQAPVGRASRPQELRRAPVRQAVLEPTPAQEDESSAGEERAPVNAERPPASAAELTEFRAFVNDTLRELRDEEAHEMTQGIERRAEHLGQSVAMLEELLELSTQQADQLRTAILLRLDREGEYVWQWKNGADEQILGELKASDLETHRGEVAVFLTPEQLEAYMSQLGK